MGHGFFKTKKMRQFIHSKEHAFGLHNLRFSPTLKITVSDGKRHGNHSAGTTVLVEVKKYPNFPNTQAVF